MPAHSFFCASRLWTIGICLCFSSIYAQNSPILEAYIQTGISQNLSIQHQTLEIQKAQQLVRQTRSMSKLKLAFDANYTLAAGGRKLDFPIGDLLNPVYGTLNQLTQSNNFQSVENAQIQFLPNNFHETKISFAYPLYNTDLKYGRAIQEHLLESKTALKSAQEQALRYDITKAYLQYLQSLEAEKVWQSARTVLLELRRFNESLVNNNVATRDVVATAEYELSKAENEIFGYQSKQSSARAYFNFLLNREFQDPIEADSNLLKSTVPQYELAALIRGVQGQRQELAAIESSLNASESNIRRNEVKQKLPDFYLGGSLGFQGFGYQFNKEQAYVLGQVGLTYNLYDAGLQKSKTQEARLDNQLANNQLELVKQQLALEVTAAWNELDAARFAYQSAQRNVEAAKSIFRIANNKYRAGQLLLIEFLDAQNRVNTAELQQLLSWTDVLLKEAALKKAAGL